MDTFADDSESPATAARVRVRLLGGVDVDCGTHRIERLPSRAVAALLARLALAPHRVHPREELIELLWPGVELGVGRNRLRQALSTLKRLVEPPGLPAVIVADRHGLRVAGSTIACDAREFEALARSGRGDEAASLYRGELMPGHYEDWVDEERLRLAALRDRLDTRPRSGAAHHDGHPAVRAPARVDIDEARAHTAALPTYLTRYFADEADLGALQRALTGHRLVTLVGPGGSGKSRTAVEAAHRLSQVCPSPFDTLAFVPLVACTQAAQVTAAIALALRLPAHDGDAIDGVVDALVGRRALLVLDNFEQLVDAAGTLVAELLARLPALHLLVTSRRALQQDGEREWPVAPLPLPAAAGTLAAAARCASVALFVDRARAVRADFHLGERNVGAVVELVRLLEGTPLAIELAASRARSFSPKELLAALRGPASSLDLLARAGARSAMDPRHASMRRVIEWSWQQLTPELAHALAALTVYDGPFVAAAASAVLEVDAAPLLDELAARSLLRVHGGGDAARFALYEAIREYAAEHVTPADATRWRARARGWLLRWAQALPPHAAPVVVHAELANIGSFLASMSGPDEARQAVELAVALRRYWDTDGMSTAQLDRLDAALDEVDRAPDAAGAPLLTLRSRAHELLAYLRFEGGAASLALAHAEQALRCAGTDASLRARALARRAWVQIARKQQVAAHEAPLREALALAEACGDLEAQARALHQLSIVAYDVHAGFDAAAAMLARAQALWERLGDRSKAMARLRNRGQVMQREGRHAEALAIYEGAEQIAQADGDWVGVIDSTLSQGTLHAGLRRWPEAARALARCARVSWTRHHAHGLAYALWNQARVLAHLRRPEAAARLVAFAAWFWESRFGPLTEADLRYVRRVRGLSRRLLGPARLETLWTEGRTLELADAVTLACAEDADSQLAVA
jgi:predicted ATPase